MPCSVKIILPDLQPQPNLADQIFISSLDSNNFDEQEFFSQITLTSLSFIVKIAKFSVYFVTLCEKNEYCALWKQLYSALGLIITKNKPCAHSFFAHDEEIVNHFTLLRGAYYFHLSQQALDAKEKAFSSLELYWLNQAMKFASIHANQRYIQFLYQKLERVSQEEAEKILIEAINCCKTSLTQYGSYAYMMLAEAFFRYAVWAQQTGNLSRTKSAISAAVKACIKAENYLSQSIFSIHNASLGEGIKMSNSLGLESPQEALLFLNNWVINNLQEQELVAVP
ncbi:DUF5630 domain-containing protein [Legionella cincinnatiensis]|uniref:Ankyrin repeat protein n=1 Tax=Legionella cincinnatiensis TaxID=28085 RepID=A0A378IN46_9GAMM|nr:DUF5630 domain-containing protein [Legionella cincinnatiensis]KTC93430.1 hypothetical protein Lcin_0468 [Legionella cincinnatiensis]STX36569.1 Uncharacterised protein [Legionella cincinnatiensis]